MYHEWQMLNVLGQITKQHVYIVLFVNICKFYCFYYVTNFTIFCKLHERIICKFVNSYVQVPMWPISISAIFSRDIHEMQMWVLQAQLEAAIATKEVMMERKAAAKQHQTFLQNIMLSPTATAQRNVDYKDTKRSSEETDVEIFSYINL